MVNLRKLIFISLAMVAVACGVKKPPTPLYTMPQDLFGAPSPTPSPTPTPTTKEF